MQMDRMASLGRLSATVAHEINNPLAGILTYARLVERELAAKKLEPAALESMRRSLQAISSETRRCGEIARNLLVFARTAALRTETVHLLEVVTRSLGLVQHHFELRGIAVRQIVRDGLGPGGRGPEGALHSPRRTNFFVRLASRARTVTK